MAEMHWMVAEGNLETEGKKSSFSGPVAFLTQAGRHHFFVLMCEMALPDSYTSFHTFKRKALRRQLSVTDEGHIFLILESQQFTGRHGYVHKDGSAHHTRVHVNIALLCDILNTLQQMQW